MAKTERVEMPIEEFIGDDREFAAEMRAVESASIEAARFVRTLRERAGLTQRELAQRLGVSQPRVSAMEKAAGPEGPTYAMLKRVARACGAEWSLATGLDQARAVAASAAVGVATDAVPDRAGEARPEGAATGRGATEKERSAERPAGSTAPTTRARG
jgi:transcriptional regulator with XRE-family HTH domain